MHSSIFNLQKQRYAFITGITGQDGSFLAELLLEKCYKVFGIIRRSSIINTERVEHIRDSLSLHYGDVCDMAGLVMVLTKIKKEIGEERLEVYHLAAQSHVGISFELPIFTGQVDAIGTLNVLEAIRSLDMTKQVRFYNAATSELFGGQEKEAYNEESKFNPRSPYAVAKLYAYHITKNYRESYDMFACSGVLFNHESERRGFNFVTRKITLELGKIVRKKITHMELGNLDSKRDWGYSPDYCEAMWMMLQRDSAEDFVIGTGEQYSVRDFVEMSFSYLGMEIEWSGEGLEEVGRVKETGQVVVSVNPKYYRPAEVDSLLCDPTKANTVLGWSPRTSFKDMVKIMVTNDL